MNENIRPDTFVYTTADNAGFLLPQKGAYFVVGNDGRIFWPNPLPEMKLRCRMHIAWVSYFKFEIYSNIDEFRAVLFSSHTMINCVPLLLEVSVIHKSTLIIVL